MKQKATLIQIIEYSKGNKKELNLINAFIKKHNFFKGERKKLYSLIIKYKKFK